MLAVRLRYVYSNSKLVDVVKKALTTMKFLQWETNLDGNHRISVFKIKRALLLLKLEM